MAVVFYQLSCSINPAFRSVRQVSSPLFREPLSAEAYLQHAKRHFLFIITAFVQDIFGALSAGLF
jgi:hypothetical protein